MEGDTVFGNDKDLGSTEIVRSIVDHRMRGVVATHFLLADELLSNVEILRLRFLDGYLYLWTLNPISFLMAFGS
jgi:hypothetical protein